jgi:AcrR family transcriptional regulator
MARNKYPEQTIEQILNIATTLFIENGYEKTTIQDIINKLKMSKGAIYHHFKSKEEILEAVINRRSIYAREMLDILVKNTKADNTKEKIKKILYEIATDTQNHAIDIILCSQINNPQFVVAGLQGTVKDDASVISKLFMEGVLDGSIETQYPMECAEIFMLLLNIWTNPVLFYRNLDETERRFIALQQIMKKLGIDIVSDELINIIISSYKEIGGFTNK